MTVPRAFVGVSVGTRRLVPEANGTSVVPVARVLRGNSGTGRDTPTKAISGLYQERASSGKCGILTPEN